MSFCTNCGAKQDTGAKFCSLCGQPVSAIGVQQTTGAASNKAQGQPAAANAASVSYKGNRERPVAVKTRLLRLSNIFFGLYVPMFFLLTAQEERGFRSLLSELVGLDGMELILLLTFIFVLIGVVAGTTYFTVRVQGINKDKPRWVLGTFIVLAGLMAFDWGSANFSGYNWADWTGIVLDLIHLAVLYAIYHVLNAANSATDSV